MAQKTMTKENVNRRIKVTVAMPAYNAADYIQESIESVLAQEYKNFELIINDDCSKDDTWRIINRYKTDSRVKLYRNSRNLGQGATMNKIISCARGEYITPCDADDLMLAGNLKRLSTFLDKHKTIGVVYADLLVMDMFRSSNSKKAPRIVGRDFKKVWDLTNNCVNHGGSMIRKKLIKKVQGYDEKVYDRVDYSLWLKLAEITEFKYLKGEVYYIYKRRSGSLTHLHKHFESDTRRLIKETIKRRFNFNFRFPVTAT